MALPIFVRTPQPKVHPRQTTGRLETVSGNSSGTFTYGYEPNSGLIKAVTRPGLLETQPALRVTNTWDPARDVLLTKANELVLGETTTDVSSITYTVNPIGQRTHATRTGAATNGTEWGYDTLGQLETADDTNPAADRAYQYDSIGNRLFSEISNTQISNPPQATTTAYAPNLLNQYGNITTGNTSFTPSHDDDGNQKNAQIQPLGSSGPASCVYHWDAENRLTSVTSQDGEVLVSYLYDAQSRLISRKMWQPTAKAVPVGDQNVVGSELLWRTVRSDGGLALPVFVRTPQPKVRCPRSARAMRRASVSSGRCDFHRRCERPWHSRHGMSPPTTPAYPASFSHATASKRIRGATRRDDVAVKVPDSASPASPDMP